MSVTFSVIVPFLNEEKYIQRCITSLLNQSYPKHLYEIIFINNNSTDHSENIVKLYSDIKLLHEPKHGSYAARNTGIKYASGLFCVFTDADCEVNPHWLQTYAESFQNHALNICCGQIDLNGSKSGLLAFANRYSKIKLNYEFKNLPSAYRSGYGGNLSVRKTVFEKIGYFSETARGNDSEFVYRYSKKFPADSATFLGDNPVTHLEIDTFPKYLAKLSVYGTTRRNNVHSTRTITPVSAACKSVLIWIRQSGPADIIKIFGFLPFLLIIHLSFRFPWIGSAFKKFSRNKAKSS